MLEIGQLQQDEVGASYEVMAQLRSDIPEEEYVARVRSMMATEGYLLAALRQNGRVVGVAGYRYLTMLYCGKILSVDDLVVDESMRSVGVGKTLIRWLEDEANRHHCSQIQLISRVTRERAHRFYFRQKFGIECFHFRRILDRQSNLS